MKQSASEVCDEYRQYVEAEGYSLNIGGFVIPVKRVVAFGMDRHYFLNQPHVYQFHYWELGSVEEVLRILPFFLRYAVMDPGLQKDFWDNQSLTYRPGDSVFICTWLERMS